MPTPIIGIGDQFAYATIASPSTYTTLNGVMSIAFSGDKVSTEKTTTMASTSGVDTYINSTQEPGSVDVKGFYYPSDTTQVGLEAIRLAGQTVSFKTTYGSANNSITFSGIVESFTPSFSLDKPASLDIKVKISGPKTYA